MKVIIANTSKLKVALQRAAKKQGYTSRTSILAANNMNSSIINDGEVRFQNCFKKVGFNIDEYTTYGAFYEDAWKQIVSLLPDIKESDFVLEKVEKPLQNATKYKELDSRIAKLEDTVLRLMKLVEKLRKDVD
jgi:hypothetical protein